MGRCLIFPYTGTLLKGRGIDEQVSLRTGTSEWIVLVHCEGTHRGCAWCGNALLLFVLLNLALGGNRILWWRKSHSVWDTSRSLFPCDDKKAWDVCYWCVWRTDQNKYPDCVFQKSRLLKKEEFWVCLQSSLRKFFLADVNQWKFNFSFLQRRVWTTTHRVGQTRVRYTRDGCRWNLVKCGESVLTNDSQVYVWLSV